MTGRKSVETVTIAKGICIILVVAGHFSTAGEPGYWTVIRNVIYRFHMPLFFMLAGYLFGLAGGSEADYRTLLKQKVGRLAYPFISIAFFVFVVKYVSQLFFDLQNPLTIRSLLQIFYDPMESYNPLLWFIYALFIIFLIHPLLSRLFRRQELVMVFTFVLSFIAWPGVMTLDHVFYNLPVFTVGVLIGKQIDLDGVSLPRNVLVMVGSLLVFSLIYINKTVLAELPGAGPTGKFVLSVSGSAFIISLSSIVVSIRGIIKRTLMAAGFYSMSIYLLHTIFESGMRIFFYQVIGVGNGFFVFSLICAILAGVLMPVVIEKYLLRKTRITRRMVLGIR